MSLLLLLWVVIVVTLSLQSSIDWFNLIWFNSTQLPLSCLLLFDMMTVTFQSESLLLLQYNSFPSITFFFYCWCFCCYSFNFCIFVLVQILCNWYLSFCLIRWLFLKSTRHHSYNSHGTIKIEPTLLETINQKGTISFILFS